MIDYVTHYYNQEIGPFQSLSALSDAEALPIMERLCDDTPFGARFKQPLQYWQDRKATEAWVRAEFIAKGGKPQAAYPIPMVLGSSPWIVANAPDQENHREIRIPLAVFDAEDISFTYPDSMISRWFGQDQPVAYYQAELHGKVFTRTEILKIVAEKGLPETHWETNLPRHLAPYIEAQVWHHERLFGYWQSLLPDPAQR